MSSEYERILWQGPTYTDLEKEVERLRSDRTAVIEECAQVAERWLISAEQGSGEDLIDAIRALKEKSP